MGKLLNAVRVNCSTTGTGLTLALGTATGTGFQTVAAAGAAAGEVYTYTIDDAGGAREITFGTVGAGGTSISRAATPIYSTNAGAPLSLSGSATISFGPAAQDLMTPDLFGTPGAPQAGLVRLGETAFANCDVPTFRTAKTPERLLLPWNMRTRHWGIFCTASQNRAIGINDASFITQTNQTGPGYASTNYFTRQNRNHFQTTATALSVGALYMSVPAPIEFIGTGSNSRGFLACFRFGVSTAVTAQRLFVGMSSNTAAPTNANPSTLTNQIGFAAVDGSNNMNVVWGGSAAQTAVDLGANFPLNTSSTDWYEGWLFSDPNDNSRVDYTVIRWTGDSIVPANVVSGSLSNSTPGTTLPSISTGLVARAWMTNNTTAANGILAIGSMQSWAE